MKTTSKLLNLGDVANSLHLSLPTVRRMARADLIAGVVRTKLGLRVDQAQFEKWIEDSSNKKHGRFSGV